jgi:ADP-ribose pyrophosphatase
METKIEKIYTGSVIDLTIEHVQLPNGQDCELEIIHHPGGVAIAALNDQNEICMLYQFRHAVGGWIWEIPAGKLEAGEAHAITAQRELQEEAGVNAQQWHYFGKIISSPGVFTERVHLYLATKLSTAQQQLEHAEVLEVHWLPLDKVMAMVKAGEIEDAKSLVALFHLQQYLSEQGHAR